MSLFRRRSNNCPICGFSIKRDVEVEKEQGLTSRVATAETIAMHIQQVHPDFLRWEKSRTKLSLALGVPTSVLVFLFFFFFVPLPPSAGRFVGAISFGAFFLPTFLIIGLGYRRFRTEWREKGLPPTPTYSPRLGAVSQSSLDEDPAILGIIHDLEAKLSITYPTITAVRWQTMIPQGKGFQVVRADNCIIQGSTVYFAENMKGRLNPIEWAPIIASSLIYSRKLGSRKVWGILARVVPIVILYTLGWILLPPLFPTTSSTYQGKTAVNNIAWDILILGGPVLAIVAIPIIVLYLKKVGFVADREASSLVGLGPFQASLRKIGESGHVDTASIERRIENLNRTS